MELGVLHEYLSFTQVIQMLMDALSLCNAALYPISHV
jgi:hypothetical protein